MHGHQGWARFIGPAFDWKQPAGAFMSEKRVDRRIGKTRDALANALFALIQREDWMAITIQSICDEADVARASFYAHFDSKVGLLDFMMERNLGSLAAHLSALGTGGAGVLDWFVDHVTSDRSRFARIVLAPDAHPALTRFKAIVKAQYGQALLREGVAAREAQLNFIMGGATEMIMDWSRTWRPQHVAALRRDVLAFAAAVLAQPLTNPRDGLVGGIAP
jgi:AcrR family transcriptional regulator